MSGIAPPGAEFEAARFLSMSRRIGRLRYFTYTLAAALLGAALLVVIYLLSMGLPPALGRLVSTVSFILVKNVGMPLIVVTMTVRRLHDINASGWWALTVIVPFVTLILLFIPGSKGANRFGPLPAPNSTSLRFAAVLMPTAVIAFYLSLYAGHRIEMPQAATAPHTPGLKAY